jgi:hypothetical protein
MMRMQRLLRLSLAALFAATVVVGFDATWAEARRIHGGGHGSFRHHGVRHHGFNRHHHHFRGSRVFLGVGLGLVGIPYAYSAYPYAPYPVYYGACYAYDAYGRCLSYSPRGYYYPY